MDDDEWASNPIPATEYLRTPPCEHCGARGWPYYDDHRMGCPNER
jgi:hypothetical protein